MNIETLYKEYVQKSRIFLYPLLGFIRGGSVTPIEIYVSWEGRYTTADCKLIVVYYMRDDSDFKQFEKTRLLGNKLFHEHHPLEEGKGVYIFDFTPHKEDFENFLEGRYSRLSPELKRKIQAFFGVSNRGFIDSYLYPERYFKMFASVFVTERSDINQMENMLREVGELCSRPDLENETLIANVKDLQELQKNL